MTATQLGRERLPTDRPRRDRARWNEVNSSMSLDWPNTLVSVSGSFGAWSTSDAFRS